LGKWGKHAQAKDYQKGDQADADHCFRVIFEELLQKGRIINLHLMATPHGEFSWLRGEAGSYSFICFPAAQ